MAEIRFDSVSKRFDSTVVLQDLNLTIADGEFFTFVGPSGCGKSTVLNMIAGLEGLSGGRILFDGEPVDALSPRDRDVAMVFQNYALYPHMTVFENIAFPLRMKKEDQNTIGREVGRVAELLGIRPLLERRPREISGGQRQRVALGRAIIRRPRVFLMDEPLSNLDARLRVEMRAEMKRLHRELGITTVYVTHDQSEAMGLSSRLAVLDRGEIRQVGLPLDVYRRPADRFVAGFIGSPPMNFISCDVTSREPFTIECLGRRIVLSEVDIPGKDRVIAGIRPEHIHAEARGEPGDVEVEVVVTEPAGSVLWVETDWRGTAVRAAAGPDVRFLAGGRAYLRFVPSDMLLFDADRGVRL